MLANKYLLMAMSLASAVIAWGLTYDWAGNPGFSKYATTIVGVLSTVKFALNMYAPSAGQTVVPTGGSVVTHTVSNN